MSWRGPLAVLFYLAAEVLLWYLVLRSFATALERDAFRELARTIELGIAAGDFLEPDRARAAQAIAQDAGDHVLGGPPFVIPGGPSHVRRIGIITGGADSAIV